jgi:hypothetical protein
MAEYQKIRAEIKNKEEILGLLRHLEDALSENDSFKAKYYSYKIVNALKYFE